MRQCSRFEIPAEGGFFWKAAPPDIVLKDSTSSRGLRARRKELKADRWRQPPRALRDASSGRKSAAAGQELAQADELHFVLDGEGELLVDEVLLYAPAAGDP